MFKQAQKKVPKALKVNHKGWFISHDNNLVWSKDGKRLFFGQKPVQPEVADIDNKIASYDDLFNLEKLLDKKELQVWHGDDPRINPHQAKQYDDDMKHHYLTVYHLVKKKSVMLADEDITTAQSTNNGHAMLSFSTLPYRKEITWEGRFNDVYRVNLSTGKKQLVAKKLSVYQEPQLSASGKYGHGKKHLSYNMYLLTLLAFYFHQVFELTDGFYQACRKIFGSKRYMWESFRGDLRRMIFDSWELLMDFELNPDDWEVTNVKKL